MRSFLFLKGHSDMLPQNGFPRKANPETDSSVSTDGPGLQLFNPMIFFNFTMARKRYAFNRNRTSNVEFWSFLELAICGTILSWCWAVSATAPSQPRDHVGQLPILYSVRCCQGFWILHFEFSHPIVPTKYHWCLLLLVKRRGRQ